MKRMIRFLMVPAIALGGLIAHAQTAYIPSAVNYQGTLTDDKGAAVTDGSYSLIFRIYDEAEGGINIWSREYPVYLNQGQFAVLLGPGGADIPGDSPATTDILSAFGGKDRYMELAISSNPGGSVASPSPLRPRQRIVTAPYAIHAYNADMAGFADKAAVLQRSEAQNTPRLELDGTGVKAVGGSLTTDGDLSVAGSASVAGPITVDHLSLHDSGLYANNGDSFLAFTRSSDGSTTNAQLRVGGSTAVVVYRDKHVEFKGGVDIKGDVDAVNVDATGNVSAFGNVSATNKVTWSGSVMGSISDAAQTMVAPSDGFVFGHVAQGENGYGVAKLYINYSIVMECQFAPQSTTYYRIVPFCLPIAKGEMLMIVPSGDDPPKVENMKIKFRPIGQP